MNSYKDYVVEDGRLIILRELAAQIDYRCNEKVLTEVLDAFGHRRSREWVRTQLRKMEEIGAVVTQENKGVMVGILTRAGLDHVECRSVIEGIGRPSPEV